VAKLRADGGLSTRRACYAVDEYILSTLYVIKKTNLRCLGGRLVNTLWPALRMILISQESRIRIKTPSLITKESLL